MRLVWKWCPKKLKLDWVQSLFKCVVRFVSERGGGKRPRMGKWIKKCLRDNPLASGFACEDGSRAKPIFTLTCQQLETDGLSKPTQPLPCTVSIVLPPFGKGFTLTLGFKLLDEILYFLHFMKVGTLQWARRIPADASSMSRRHPRETTERPSHRRL